MSIGAAIKDPVDIRIYTINWSAWLGSATISTSTWTVPSGLTSVTETNNTTSASIKLSGGTNGRTYSVANTVVTSGGETKKVSFDLIVETQ